jgi:hypothetical protein
MPVEVMFVAITAIVSTFFVIRMGMKHEERKLELKSREGQGVDTALHADTQAELARLRDRVAVLERLATDDDRRLAGEINRLGGLDSPRR